MPHFVATYRYARDSDARRDEHRPAHRDYLRGLDGVLLAGATQSDDGPGAVLVFEAASAAEVERLIDEDPFVTAGVVAQRSVVAWSITTGRALDAL